HPHAPTLFLDAELVCLPLPQVTRGLDHLFLDGLALDACPPQPSGARPLINPESHDDGLPWATMRHQRHHTGPRLRRRPPTRKRRAFGGGAGLPARRTAAPFLLTREAWS